MLVSTWEIRWSCPCTTLAKKDTVAEMSEYRVCPNEISIVFMICSDIGWSEAGNKCMAEGCCGSEKGGVREAILVCTEAASHLGLDLTRLAVEGELCGENSPSVTTG